MAVINTGEANKNKVVASTLEFCELRQTFLIRNHYDNKTFDILQVSPVQVLVGNYSEIGSYRNENEARCFADFLQVQFIDIHYLSLDLAKHTLRNVEKLIATIQPQITIDYELGINVAALGSIKNGE